MASTSHTFTDERLRGHLLGLGTDADTEAIDEASIADDGVAARLAALEDDLHDDYARGVLNGAERARFEERYLSSIDGRRRVEFAKALQSRASAVTPKPATGPAFRWWAVAAAVLAATTLGLILLADDPPQLTDATMRPPVTTPDPAPAAVVASFTLLPTATRSAAESPALTVPADATSINLRLVGLPETQPLMSAEVVVRTVDGREVFRGLARAVNDSGDGVRVEVAVPAAQLPPDDYLVQLNELRSGRPEERVRYFLRVRR